MSFLIWVYIYQDFAQAEQNVAQSHNCMTVTFRSSAFYEHFRWCLSVIIQVTALLNKAFEVHIDIFKGCYSNGPKRFNEVKSFLFPPLIKSIYFPPRKTLFWRDFGNIIQDDSVTSLKCFINTIILKYRRGAHGSQSQSQHL